jgi:hypothetical protein
LVNGEDGCIFEWGFLVWIESPASKIIGPIGGASPKPGNGEDCIRKGIWHKILASSLLFEYQWII